jgi:hypothetical protein
MSGADIRSLVEEIQQVGFREFWWDSQLLKACSQVNDPRVVRALLIRHHCLQNKQADSAHVLRNTIKELEGPDFPTLWHLIDSESNTNRLIGSIDDPHSGTWAATYVLGDIGGAPALSKATSRLGPADSTRHFLIAKLAYHLVVRYMQILSEREPTATEFDVKTGEKIEVLTRLYYPDVYHRQMLRRQQANEYFIPVQPQMLTYLKSHLSKIPDNFIPISKWELFRYIDRIPTLDTADRPHRREPGLTTVTTLDLHGRPAGSVTRLNDGRHMISAGPSADSTTLLMSMFVVFADELTLEQRVAFSRWADLPSHAWAQAHREAFALAMLHYFREVAESGGNLPPEVESAAGRLLGSQHLPLLARPISREVRRIFESLFNP